MDGKLPPTQSKEDREEQQRERQPIDQTDHRKTRPKFSIEYLQHPALGLEEVNRNFQNAFKAKVKGKGYEEHDLSLLLSLYINWQKRLFPYLDFDTFLRRVEAIGQTQSGQVIRAVFREQFRNDMSKIMNERSMVEASGSGINPTGEPDHIDSDIRELDELDLDD